MFPGYQGCKSEIDEMHSHRVFAYDDVGRVQVAVNHAFVVDRLQCFGDFHGNIELIGQTQRIVLDHLA